MTLQVLRELSRQEGLAAFLDETLSPIRTNVQGVCVAYDPYWLAFALIHLSRRWAPDLWMYHSRARDLAWPRYQEWFREAINDMRPSDWDAYCETRGYRKGSRPVVIKVLVRQRITHDMDLPSAWENDPIVYVQEPPCIAFTQPLVNGDELGQAGPDTLGSAGGYLQHSNGTYYITTAAHVLPNRLDVLAPSPTRAKHPVKIGTYVDGDLPAPATKCNNRSAPRAVSVDIALCEIDHAVVSLGAPLNNGISRWSMVADMTPGDLVAFAGTRTPHGQAQIADVNLWRDIDVDGQTRCYGDLFTIEPRHKVYINTNLAQPGDSGAWIVYDGHDPLRAFDGTLIGGAGARVYCSYAENVKDWCDRKFGTNNIRLP